MNHHMTASTIKRKLPRIDSHNRYTRSVSSKLMYTYSTTARPGQIDLCGEEIPIRLQAILLLLFRSSDTDADTDPAGKEAAMREECMGQDPVSMETKEIEKRS